jgi:hypothetical protein
MMIMRILAILVGLGVVYGTMLSAIKTFILPRSAPDRLTRAVFLAMRSLFALPLKRARSYSDRDRIMAYYAPFSLLALLPTWYALVALGYTGMYWGAGTESWQGAFLMSGSSLLTLGFSVPDNLLKANLVFSEAIIGLILVALLIAYLPTMYAAFSRREAAITMLEVRAGNPPSAVEMILRFHRIHGLTRLIEQWEAWERWFADVEESHTSLPALVFFRSPQSDHSWVTAAGAVLDAASLTLSTIDAPSDPQAALCIRAGYLALRHIADFFGVAYPPDPHFPDDPIRVSREEFDAACKQLAGEGVPLKNDLDQAWLDFAGWRVNYDTTLLALASLTMAPSAPWSSDRARQFTLPPIFALHK